MDMTDQQRFHVQVAAALAYALETVALICLSGEEDELSPDIMARVDTAVQVRFLDANTSTSSRLMHHH
jgi:hypothetical protein